MIKLLIGTFAYANEFVISCDKIIIYREKKKAFYFVIRCNHMTQLKRILLRFTC